MGLDIFHAMFRRTKMSKSRIRGDHQKQLSIMLRYVTKYHKCRRNINENRSLFLWIGLPWYTPLLLLMSFSSLESCRPSTALARFQVRWGTREFPYYCLYSALCMWSTCRLFVRRVSCKSKKIHINLLFPRHTNVSQLGLRVIIFFNYRV